MEAELATYARESERIRARLPFTEYAYGPGPRQRLDLFLPGGDEPAPLLAFVHGGYWQEETKERACGAAAGVVASGAAFAAIEYTLAPEASLEEILEECRAAVGWLVEHSAELGLDPGRIHLAGSSAGAHLVAMLVLTDWAARGLQPDPIRGAALLSGVYDLRPLVATYVNDPLGLDEERARRLSPLAHVAASPVPLVVAWAQRETGEFKRQGSAFADAWRAAGNRCEVVPDVPGRNHFDLPLDLGDPDSALGAAVLAQLHGSAPGGR